MILFAGIPSEGPLALAIEAADEAGVPYAVFNQRHAAFCDMDLALHEGRFDAAMVWAGSRRRLGDFTGVYARMTEVSCLPEHQPHGRTGPDPGLLARAQATSALFDNFLDVFAGRVANRPRAMGSNLSKPSQAQLIAAAGLLVPPTLITNVPEAVQAFHAEHGRVIYKSISAIRSIVREWTPEKGPDAAAVAALPTQFQAFIPGVNVRVHVVGHALFATQIDSDATDYRYGERDGHSTAMRPTELPQEVARACVDLTADLELVISGIDLKRTPEGAWYCFEVNPSPAYSFFQALGGQAISNALVSFLAAGT